MKAVEFINRFRTHLRDDSVPPFWGSDEIVGFLNEAVQEACERAKLIEDRSSDATVVQLLPAQSTYDLDCSVLQIKRATLQGRPLDETSVEELDCDDSGWERRTGKPRCFVFEPATGSEPPRIRFVATPTLADTVSLTVFRGALTPLKVDSNRGPEIPERFHERLLDWMYFRAYMKQDADAFDPKKAAESLSVFVQAFGERPDANVQRKRRDKHPRVVRMRW